MLKYTANYSHTNHNFVIQNLEPIKIENQYSASIQIIKNILQRGLPTKMSCFLCRKYGNIHQESDFDDNFILIDKQQPNWINRIKGLDNKNDNPAKIFLEKIIPKYFKEYIFLQNLIIPEIEINEITQVYNKNFVSQYVDFYLPNAAMVIEIDGIQHKVEKSININDKQRDNYLNKFGIKTIRINVNDIRNETNNLKFKINEILNFKFIKNNPEIDLIKNAYYNNQFDNKIINHKIIPTAIIRLQILILELINYSVLNLEKNNWSFHIKNLDSDLFDINIIFKHAIEDLFIWLENILKLHKINFKKPNYKIFSDIQENTINIDFSIRKYWTDENLFNKEYIYVRNHYINSYPVKINNCITWKQLDFFEISNSKPIVYKISLDDKSEDKIALKFILKNIFGHENFYDGQLLIISNALNRNDTLGLLPTGGGKSLCYQMAILLQPCIAFIVSPIRSLMYDQVSELKQILINRADCITSDMHADEKQLKLNNYSNGKYLFFLVSPERFQTNDFRNYLLSINNKYNISYAIIDEVHCLSEWGHDFRTSYLHLSNTIKKYCNNFNFLGLTATASIDVLKDIQIEFDIKKENVKTLVDFTRKELDFIVIDDKNDKYNMLLKKLQELNETYNIFISNNENSNCVIIFTPYASGKTDYGCKYIAKKLNSDLKNHLEQYIQYYSGQESNEHRKTVQNNFKDNKFTILTATKAFGMGINKPNIRFTFHYGIPASIEALYQEAGRAGRDRNPAFCYILFSQEKNMQLDKIFNIDTNYNSISNEVETIGFNGFDLSKQMFLWKSSLDSIADEYKLINNIFNSYAEPKSKKNISCGDLNTNKNKTEKAIYRLFILGIIDDWTIENWDQKYGIFNILFSNFDDSLIKKSLNNYIQKYDNNFSLNNLKNKNEYKIYYKYYSHPKLNTFKKCTLILLQWTYDNFAYKRRQSLKNVYDNCRIYNKIGKRKFKERLEEYFSFTDSSFILDNISELPFDDIDKWFEVFYKKNKLITIHEIQNLEANLSRFLETYRYNTGLNLISGLIKLFLGNYENQDGRTRFESALNQISNLNNLSDKNKIFNSVIKLGVNLPEESKKNLALSMMKYFEDSEYLLKLLNNFFNEDILIYFLERCQSSLAKSLNSIININ